MLRLVLYIIATGICIWSVVWSMRPSKGSFAWAWKLLLKGRKVRRKAWVAGVYIYADSFRLGHPECSFVFVGGYLDLSPKNWTPYIVDFSENDWEEVISLFD